MVRFKDSLKEQDFREITEAEIILGNGYDDKIITLYKWNDELGFRKSSYNIQYIFLGRHIKIQEISNWDIPDVSLIHEDISSSCTINSIYKAAHKIKTSGIIHP